MFVNLHTHLMGPNCYMYVQDKAIFSNFSSISQILPSLRCIFANKLDTEFYMKLHKTIHSRIALPKCHSQVHVHLENGGKCGSAVQAYDNQIKWMHVHVSNVLNIPNYTNCQKQELRRTPITPIEHIAIYWTIIKTYTTNWKRSASKKPQQ